MGNIIWPSRFNNFPTTLDHLFTGGEVGDFWRFDAANTDASVVTDPITEATGLVNGLLLTDPDPSNVPELSSSSGHERATFASPSDRLAYNFGSTISQPGTIIVCMNSGSVTNSRVILTGSAAGSRWQMSVDSSGSIIGFAGSSLDSTRNSPVGTKVLTFEANGASSRFRINGEGVNTDVSGSGGTQGTNQITIGALYDGTVGMGLSAYSLLFIDRILTASELDGAERLMGSHAGLSW